MNIVYCICIFHHETNEIDVETKSFIGPKFNHWTHMNAIRTLTNQSTCINATPMAQWNLTVQFTQQMEKIYLLFRVAFDIPKN